MPHAIGHKRPRPPSGQLAHHTALLSEDSSSDEYYNDKGHAGENFFRREPVKERHGKSGGGNQSSARPAGSYVPACGHVEIDGKACFNVYDLNIQFWYDHDPWSKDEKLHKRS